MRIWASLWQRCRKIHRGDTAARGEHHETPPENNSSRAIAQSLSPQASPSYWTPLRSELADWLRRNAPQLAELYEGALKILFERDFPGKLRFVTHAMHEIVNRLPDAIGVAQADRVEYANYCDEIAKDWRKHGLRTDGAIAGDPNTGTPAESGEVTLPGSLYLKFADLIKAHSDARGANTERGDRFFDAIEPDDPALQYRRVLLVREWKSIGKWAVGKAHLPVKAIRALDEVTAANAPEPSEAELRHWFERLETALAGC